MELSWNWDWVKEIKRLEFVAEGSYQTNIILLSTYLLKLYMESASDVYKKLFILYSLTS